MGLYMTDFTDMENRILDRLDKLQEKCDDICNRVAKIESETATYKELKESKLNANQWGWEKGLGITGMLGMVIAIVISLGVV